MKIEIGEYLLGILIKHFGISDMQIELTLPPKKNMGDFAFGCFSLARDLKKSPATIATDLELIINTDLNKKNIERVIADGPYLNIFISGDSYFDDFLAFLQTPERVEQKDETIIIDYIGANVGKPLHIGHMCTPTQWQAIINVYKKLWYKSLWDTHIGDWGIIFWKLIRAYQEFGSEGKLHSDAVEHLFELYVKITSEAEKRPELDEEFRNTFKKLSQGDREMVELWKQFTGYSIEAMDIQLTRLWVEPDYNIWESFFEGIGLPKLWDYPDLEYSMKDVVKELVEKKIATQNEDGSVGVEFPETTKMPSCILQKRDGTHGYLASDLACIKYRMGSWAPEKIIYCNDMRQQLHFRQAFYIAKQAWWMKREAKVDTQLIHAYNGFITLKDWAMSTRKWKIIKLNLLLNEAEERAKKIIQEKRDDIVGQELEELAKIIGLGAINYGYLKKTRESDVVFDWDEFMSFEGNSGPYIQYSYVRAKNILSEVTPELNIGKEKIEISSELKELILKLKEYNKYLQQTAEEAHPHILAGYCYELARSFNTLYNNESILGESREEYKDFKLLTLQKYVYILKEAMNALGIDMPEKM